MFGDIRMLMELLRKPLEKRLRVKIKDAVESAITTRESMSRIPYLGVTILGTNHLERP